MPSSNPGLYPCNKYARWLRPASSGLLALACALLLVLHPHAAPRPPLLAAFSIRESFGVAHPRQIIDFDYAQPVDPANSYMIGPGGVEVPFQVLSGGRVAVEAELSVFGEQTWTLYSGKAPRSFTGLVRIAEAPTYYEVTNGLTGVRIARTGTLAPSTLAPIQGILYRDDAWTATGPNYLFTPANKILPSKTFEVRILESGPLKAVIECLYTYERLDLYYGHNLLISGGPGFYRSTIELQAGQPSILIEDDTDMDLGYRLNVYPGLAPDKARYRGHHSTSVENGYEPDGRQYRS